MGMLDPIRSALSPPPVSPARSLAIQLGRAEEEVLKHDLMLWKSEQMSKATIEKHGRLSRHGLIEDKRTWDEGRDLAGDCPVLTAMALGYVEDQHIDNRNEVRRP